MTENVLLAGVTLAVLALIALGRYGAPTLVASTLVLTTALFPKEVSPYPLSTYGLAILGGALFLACCRLLRLRTVGGFLPFALFGAFGLAFFWFGGIETAPGLAYLILAGMAWVVGTSVRSGLKGNMRSARAFILVILGILIFQATVSVFQTLGFPIFAVAETTAELTEGRSSGTFPHPGTVGKAILCLMALVLPFTVSANKSVSKLATCSIVVGLLPVLLSLSRANIVGVAVLLVGWVILAPRKKARGLKIAIPVVLGTGAIVFMDQLVQRFGEDTEGGERERFLRVALDHIPDHLWEGVGPKNYVAYFGQFDSLTAEGWPVHNTFLLAIAELGVIGAVLLFGHWIVSFAVSIRGMLSRRSFSADCRAYIALGAAILPIALTGWGMLDGSILPLWFFTSAFLVPSKREMRPPAFLASGTAARLAEPRPKAA